MATTSPASAPPAATPAPRSAALPNLIPPFGTSGVLPPFVGANAALPAGRAPYRTTLIELVDRFATSPERKEILEGYLNHREALIALGFTGFQWLDGSFLEDIETTEGRAPRDIDVISFVSHPPAFVQNPTLLNAVIAANIELFDPNLSKQHHKTDARFVDTTWGIDLLIRQTAYWFGLFSHRRNDRVWKGMLEITLNASEDPTPARTLLASR